MPALIYFVSSDNDECQENTSGCSQECNNTVGGYECYCKDGYRLTNDSHTCDGKAIQAAVCSKCNDTVGNFKCYIVLMGTILLTTVTPMKLRQFRHCRDHVPSSATILLVAFSVVLKMDIKQNHKVRGLQQGLVSFGSLVV